MKSFLNSYPLHELLKYLEDCLNTGCSLSNIMIDGNKLIIEFSDLDRLAKVVEFLKSLEVTNIQRHEIRIAVDKQFEEYLRKDRQLSERMIRDYLNYLRKVENEVLDYRLYLHIANHKWLVKTVRLYLDYLYKSEKISAEEYQKLRSIFKVKQKWIIDNMLETLDEILQS